MVLTIYDGNKLANNLVIPISQFILKIREQRWRRNKTVKLTIYMRTAEMTI